MPCIVESTYDFLNIGYYLQQKKLWENVYTKSVFYDQKISAATDSTVWEISNT